MKINIHRAALTGAIYSALLMLLLSLANGAGLYTGATNMMQQWHMYYRPSTVGGTIGGMLEAAVFTYVSIWIIFWIYGWLEQTSKKK